MTTDTSTTSPSEALTTREVAAQLGLAVRSVQLMVDRGELSAWKTSGGHRRISQESVTQWLAKTDAAPVASSRAMPAEQIPLPSARRRATDTAQPSVLLIEDSAHFQNMIRLLLARTHPHVKLHLASDAVVGLALCGALRPDVLIVDILLPDIDGATLINSVRSQQLFEGMQLLVVTSLDASEREPYAHALAGVPVIEKQHLTMQLAPQLTELLAGSQVARR